MRYSWDEVRDHVQKNKWWGNVQGQSVRDVLSRLADTNRCIGIEEHENAEKHHAEEIIAALDDAGYAIVPKTHK